MAGSAPAATAARVACSCSIPAFSSSSRRKRRLITSRIEATSSELPSARLLIVNLRYSDFLDSPSSKTTIEATTLEPWMCEMS